MITPKICAHLKINPNSFGLCQEVKCQCSFIPQCFRCLLAQCKSHFNQVISHEDLQSIIQAQINYIEAIIKSMDQLMNIIQSTINQINSNIKKEQGQLWQIQQFNLQEFLDLDYNTFQDTFAKDRKRILFFVQDQGEEIIKKFNNFYLHFKQLQKICSYRLANYSARLMDQATNLFQKNDNNIDQQNQNFRLACCKVYIVLQIEPNNFLALFYQGNIENRFQRQEQALEYYNKAQLIQVNLELIKNKTRTLLNLCKYEDAIKLINKFKQDFYDEEIQQFLSQAYFYNQQYIDSLEILENFVEIHQDITLLDRIKECNNKIEENNEFKIMIDFELRQIKQELSFPQSEIDRIKGTLSTQTSDYFNQQEYFVKETTTLNKINKQKIQ